MVATLRAYLLGPLEIHRGEVPLALPGSVPARSLLAYLCLHHTQAIPRPVLAGTFWPEQPESSARRALSQALWHIRRAIPDLIKSDTHTVQISPEQDLWIDVTAFRTLTGTIHQYPAKQQKTIDDLHQATRLYRGDLLSGFYDEWIFIEREGLREQYLQALELLIHTQKSTGHYAEALEYGNQLLKADPLGESTYRAVMQINLALGRPEAALQIFERCRQTLQTELDIEPEPETIALAQEISNRTQNKSLPYLPQTRKTETPLAAEPQQPVKIALVGRANERGELLNCIEELFDHHGGVLLIEGDAGVGKTRLLQEVMRDAEWRNAQVLWGHCFDIEGTQPFAFLVDAIHSGLSQLRISQLAQLVDPIWLQTLSPLLPEFATTNSTTTTLPALSGDETQTRLVNAFTQLLISWGEIMPLVVVIEDLHWADIDTLNLLISLAQRILTSRVLIMVSCRSDEIRALPQVWEAVQNLDRAGLRQRLVLQNLDSTATSELIRRCLRLADEAPLFEERLHYETGGNPLFLLETLRSLLEEGLLHQDANGNWHTPWDEVTINYAELPLPVAVEEVIRQRLVRLPEKLRTTLNLAAVLGNEFDFTFLRHISNEETNSLFTTINELIRRNFLRETPQAYRFSHDKIREVTYQAIEPKDKINLHHHAGEVLEGLHPDRVANLAYHFSQAQVWEKAITYYQKAGDQAIAVYANQEAIAHYSSGLKIIERQKPIDLELCFELHLAREKIYRHLWEQELLFSELTHLAQIADQLDNDLHRAQVAIQRAKFFDQAGNFPDAILAAQKAIELAQQVPDTALEAKGYLNWGNVLQSQGEYPQARTQLKKGLALIQTSPARRTEAGILLTLGNIAYLQGNNTEAYSFYERALQIFRTLGDRPNEGQLLNNIGLVTINQNDYARAREYFEQARQIGQQTGSRKAEGMALGNLGVVYGHQGYYTEAQDCCLQELQICREVGDLQAQGRLLLNLGIIGQFMGDYAKAKTSCEQALQISREMGDGRIETWSLAYLGLVAHHLADNLAAQEFCQQALEIARGSGDRYVQGQTLIYLGHALTDLGEAAETNGFRLWDQAANAYQEALAIQRTFDQSNLILEPLAGLARVALRQNNLDQAQIHVTEILAQLEHCTLNRLGEPFRVHLTCYRVLSASQNPQADKILQTAYYGIQDRAAKIQDKDMRRSYLENIVSNRTIIQQFEAGRMRSVTVRLPRIGTPVRRVPQEGDWVQVTWSIAIPEDKQISGKANRRKARLLRLLGEAETQGGVPSLDDLAATLGVSVPTIKRDLAQLRSQGHTIKTRGSRST